MAANTGEWRTRAIIVSAAGLLFSLLLSFCILLGSHARLWPMPAIKRAGIDLSMVTFVALSGVTDGPQKNEGRYTFIDVDDASRTHFTPLDNPACRGKESVPVALISDFLRAANGGGAQVVIVDVMPDDQPCQAALLSVLQKAGREHNAPWIIGILPSRSADSTEGHLTVTADLSRLAIDGASRLRLAADVTAPDPDTWDGVVRSYPLLASVHDSRNGYATDIPTIPFLASMLASANTARAADCQLYPRPSCRAGKLPPKLRNLVDLARDTALKNKIFYSLPGLCRTEIGSTNDTASNTSRYHRFLASDFFNRNHFNIPADNVEDTVRDRIVILGSSASMAEDCHITPIGPMSGAEIVLNATRAIQEFSALEAEGAHGKSYQMVREFGERLRAAVIGLAVFLPGWLIIFWLIEREWPGSALLRYGLISVVFVGALMAALILEFIVSVSELRASIETGVETDMLTPVLALGLEGFAEAAKVVSRLLERAVEWVACSAREIAIRAWAKFNFYWSKLNS